ncbi:type I-E CRISPR-associated protein Cse2/CasB [Streptomyces sp. NPDC000405]|uniref:type I-E CRISPR-associated protein Cse2/CasB n=1 Tax=Streptomyces sp. NPDC000405 TaxID=3161033 RepID=UPI00398D35B3
MAQRTTVSLHSPGPNGQLRPLPGLAVSQVVGRLQAGYRQDAPWAVASVARLRREAGREVHVSPTAWGLDHLEKLADLREERRSAEREARSAGTADLACFSSVAYVAREAQERREDTAVHLAVTLWALHQQSLREDSMHQPGWPLGRAVRRLAHGRSGASDTPAAKDTEAGDTSESTSSDEKGSPAKTAMVEEASEAVRRRFVRVGSASDTEVLATRLRELVLLLRAARIPLDYARLADQLLQWQDENLQDTVRRTWGRDFHRRYPPAGGASRTDDETAVGSVGSSVVLDDEAVGSEELDGDF